MVTTAESTGLDKLKKRLHRLLKDNPGGDDGPVPFAKSEGPGLFHFLAAFDP